MLPTTGNPGKVSTSVTDWMMLAEPSQKKLTTIASPWCGFVGLNPLMSTVPLSCSVPFNWLPTTRNSGAPGYAGATGSAQAAPSKLAPTSAASLTIVVRFTITPPLLVAQTEPQTNKTRGKQPPSGARHHSPILKGALTAPLKPAAAPCSVYPFPT